MLDSKGLSSGYTGKKKDISVRADSNEPYSDDKLKNIVGINFPYPPFIKSESSE